MLRPLVLGKRVEKFEGNAGAWTIHFGDVRLNIGCPWRLFVQGSLKFCSSDHKQKFGLPQPFDAESEASKILQSKTLQDFSIAKSTTDLVLDFEDTVKVELLQNSSGYEAWNFSGPKGCLVVARVLPSWRFGPAKSYPRSSA
jgi:hypothetical protein